MREGRTVRRGSIGSRLVPALETTVLPRPPYSLALSARLRSDATRTFREGVLTMALEAGGPALARVYQRPDGSLAVHVEGSDPDAALELVRFVLAAEEDHRHFLRRFERDPLLAEPLRRLRYGAGADEGSAQAVRSAASSNPSHSHRRTTSSAHRCAACCHSL